MEDSLTLSTSGLKSNKLTENNYKLALKLFVNKNFEKSYGLINQLYQQSFGEFSSGLITEGLFIKILNLYLIQNGVSLSSSDGPEEIKVEIIRKIQTDAIIGRLLEVFSTEQDIPYEILYNYYLLIITNKDSILSQQTQQDWFLTKLSKLYSVLDYNRQDKYLKKLLDLYIFEILPAFDKFDESETIIRENSLYNSDLESKLSTLKEVKAIKKDQLKREQKKALEQRKLEAEAKQKELARLKEIEKSQNLNYRSIKEIKETYTTETTPSTQTSPDTSNHIEETKRKALYLYGLSKNYLRENSIVLIVVLLGFLVSTKFINYRKINFKERLRETVKMAFQVSYL